MKLVECITKANLNRNNSTTSAVLNNLGKYKVKAIVKLYGKKKVIHKNISE